MLKNNLAKYAEKIRFFDYYGNLRRKITKSQVIILLYHRIGPMSDKWKFDPLNPQIFEEQIKYFVENFEIISLKHLNRMILNGDIPEKAVAITIDDGYKDNYKFAYPILKKYSIPATIFLSTGIIDQKKLLWDEELSYVLLNTDKDSIDIKDMGFYKLNSDENRIKASLEIARKLEKMDNNEKESMMEKVIDLLGVNIPDKLGKQNIISWNEIKRMNEKGIDFGAHTVNHPILTSIDIDDAKWEVSESKNRIEEVLGVDVNSFSYPNGDYNDKILSLVKDAGFNSSVSVEPGFVNNSVDELYQLKRINGTTKDLHVLKLSLCGLWGLRNF